MPFSYWASRSTTNTHTYAHTHTLAFTLRLHPCTASGDERWDRNLNFTRREHSYRQRRPIYVSELIISTSPSKILMYELMEEGRKANVLMSSVPDTYGRFYCCRLLYLPVRRPVILAVFLLLLLSLPLSLAQWSLGWDYKRWKENKMPFDPAALCYSSVKEHYGDNPTKREEKKYQSQKCSALMHSLLMHRQIRTGWRNRNAAEWTQRPCKVPLTFLFYLFGFPVASSTELFHFSQHHFSVCSDQITELHTTETHCFIFDIFTEGMAILSLGYAEKGRNVTQGPLKMMKKCTSPYFSVW